MIYYPIPLHLQPLYSDLRTPTLPKAELAAQEVLSLPICPELSSKDQEFIVELIRDFFDDQD
jgi:dTDP-4-amino-4,6-dideoxygalactose transaminase